MKDVVLLDGAVGTSLWEKASDKVPVWRYNMENPAIVAELADEYAKAGAQIILANTFSANATSVKGMPYTAADVVRRGVAIAKDAIAGRAQCALSVGPLAGLLEPYGDITEEEALAIFDEQIGAGVESGADLIYCQTFMDLEMMKLALRVAFRHDLPVMCSFSFDKKGRTMMGNPVSAIVEELKAFPLQAIGLNCSLGPEMAVPVIAMFHEETDLPLIFKPNAGKPIMTGAGEQGMQFDADTFVEDSLPALQYGVKYIGGCCGSNARYIERLGRRLRDE